MGFTSQEMPTSQQRQHHLPTRRDVLLGLQALGSASKHNSQRGEEARDTYRAATSYHTTHRGRHKQPSTPRPDASSSDSWS